MAVGAADVSKDWPRPDVEVRDLFGIPVQAATMDDAVAMVERAIVLREPLHVGVVNAAKIVNMRKNPKLDEAVRSSDAIFADGMSVVWASRFLRRPLPTRVAGIDLMHEILRSSAKNGFRVYCLGAKQDIIEKVVKVFEADYPGAVIAGWRNGYFGVDEEEEIAEAVRRARADVLLVAMTSPKKEEFMARWVDRMNVPVVHGVGGSFDVVGGLVERAPEGWQRLGLEWLYRVKQEPGRLWKRYLVTNVAFAGLLLRERVRVLFEKK